MKQIELLHKQQHTQREKREAEQNRQILQKNLLWRDRDVAFDQKIFRQPYCPCVHKYHVGTRKTICV